MDADLAWAQLQDPDYREWKKQHEHVLKGVPNARLREVFLEQVQEGNHSTGVKGVNGKLRL